MEEIKNKISESSLITIDLADFKPNQNKIEGIDLSNFLWQGLVLKEKEFRTSLNEINWEIYFEKYVFIFCSTDSIIPTWAYMLIAAKLEGIVENYIVGSKMDLEKLIIQEKIVALDINLPQYDSKKYIIKGCSDILCPEFAMTELMKKIQKTAKSIMYGEPCSTVPIYKRK